MYIPFFVLLVQLAGDAPTEWASVMFCKKSRWSMCLQTIMTEAWKVNTALGQDWKCVMMPTLREWELLLILL